MSKKIQAIRGMNDLLPADSKSGTSWIAPSIIFFSPMDTITVVPLM